MAPRLIFGTATFGMDSTEFQDKQSVTSLLRTLQDAGISRYPPLNHGQSEALIGQARELSKDFVVDTKVFTDIQNDGSNDLRREAIQQSVNGSLQRLQRPEGVGRAARTNTLTTFSGIFLLTCPTSGQRALRSQSRPRNTARRANSKL